MEILIFFAAPAIATGALYIRISSNLLCQEKRVSRNRALSLTFALSWILWVVCWTPGYVIAFMQLHNNRSHFSYGFKWDTILFYLVTLKTPLKMLYSHLNPVIFIIIIKSIGLMHLETLKQVAYFSLADEVFSEEETAGDPALPKNSSTSVYLPKRSIWILGIPSILLISIIASGIFSSHAKSESLETTMVTAKQSEYLISIKAEKLFELSSFQNTVKFQIEDPRFL